MTTWSKPSYPDPSPGRATSETVATPFREASPELGVLLAEVRESPILAWGTLAATFAAGGFVIVPAVDAFAEEPLVGGVLCVGLLLAFPVAATVYRFARLGRARLSIYEHGLVRPSRDGTSTVRFADVLSFALHERPNAPSRLTLARETATGVERLELGLPFGRDYADLRARLAGAVARRLEG